MARTGKPPKADSAYRVSVHMANGYLYACTQPAIDDPDSEGQEVSSHSFRKAG